MAETRKPGTGNKQKKKFYSRKPVWVTNTITGKLLRSNQFMKQYNYLLLISKLNILIKLKL